VKGWRALTCAILLWPLVADAAFFQNGEGRTFIAPEGISYRPDDGSPFEKIAVEKQGWIAQRDRPFAPDRGSVRIWARFDLPHASPARRAFLGVGAWEHVEYFIVTDGRLVDRQVVGQLAPWNERRERITMTPVVLFGGLAGVELPAESRTTVYARLASDQRYVVPPPLSFSLRDADRALDGERRDRLILGVFYGVMLVIVLYNFGAWIAIRERSYLYFVLMQAAVALVWTPFYGLTVEFFWPAHPAWDLYFLWITLLLGGYGLAQFLRTYLETAKYFPRIEVALKIYAYVQLLAVPVVFLLPAPVAEQFDLVNYLAPVGCAIIMALLVFALIRRHPLAWNMVLAVGFVLGGLAITALVQGDMIPRYDWAFHAGQFGAALTGVVFSVGLGFRTAELVVTKRQLEATNRHKSDFLAHMSHELRTPLNSIIGFSEVLREKMFGPLNEKQDDYLKDIHDSGRHLLSLINDILDLSKIEAGKMELQLSTFDLPSAIGNAITLVRERAMRHGVALGTDIDSRLGAFDADERKLKQILLNLLSNAVKFTPQGGRVDVSAKLDTDKVEIAVRDTGAGISPEDQATLFQEFRQVGKDSARKSEGTGLGLALSKKFIELHGGGIRVDSVPGKGSTFAFTLPVR
jgi:signal transduction histidine kinase